MLCRSFGILKVVKFELHNKLDEIFRIYFLKVRLKGWPVSLFELLRSVYEMNEKWKKIRKKISCKSGLYLVGGNEGRFDRALKRQHCLECGPIIIHWRLKRASCVLLGKQLKLKKTWLCTAACRTFNYFYWLAFGWLHSVASTLFSSLLLQAPNFID